MSITKPLWFVPLAFLLLSGACAPATPAAGHQVGNQDQAETFIRGYLGSDALPMLAVEFVTPNLPNEAIDDGEGHSVWGVTIDGAVYISQRSDHFSGTSLAHELVHQLYGDAGHARRSLWGDWHDVGGWTGGLVATVNTALALHPDIDAMGAQVSQ